MQFDANVLLKLFCNLMKGLVVYCVSCTVHVLKPVPLEKAVGYRERDIVCHTTAILYNKRVHATGNLHRNLVVE